MLENHSLTLFKSEDEGHDWRLGVSEQSWLDRGGVCGCRTWASVAASTVQPV
jgi:hypothetical protein